MHITHKISSRPWGIECRFCCARDGQKDVNDIVILPSIDTDPTQLIADKIVAIDSIVEGETISQAVESSSIWATVEDDKERLKWLAVEVVRSGATADEFISTLDLHDAGIAQALIYSYAKQAYRDGYIQEVPSTKEECWAVLSGVVMSMTDEQLRGVL